MAVAFRGELAASFARRATRRESDIDHPASPARRPGCGRDLICSWTLRPSHAFWMGVRTANPKQPTDIRELVDSPIDERSLPIDLVRPDRAVLVAGCVGSRTPCASASAQRAAAQIPEASTAQQHRPAIACRALRPAPGVLDALKLVRPETLIRWRRAGFRAFWRWKSRSRGGRPTTPADIRRLIREMSVANALWGAPRIHGELLKLGIDVGQTTVAKYMARRRMPPSQGWKTFLRNHSDGIASMDLFLVPTISFRLLYGFLILQHSRRKLLWLGVTAHPSAEWIARQLTEA